jgi:hypothetical protein
MVEKKGPQYQVDGSHGYSPTYQGGGVKKRFQPTQVSLGHQTIQKSVRADLGRGKLLYSLTIREERHLGRQKDALTRGGLYAWRNFYLTEVGTGFHEEQQRPLG